MKISTKIIVGLSLVIIHDTYVGLHNRKLYTDLQRKYTNVSELANFYAGKLDEARVPATDFDKIVMQNLTDK